MGMGHGRFSNTILLSANRSRACKPRADRQKQGRRGPKEKETQPSPTPQGSRRSFLSGKIVGGDIRKGAKGEWGWGRPTTTAPVLSMRGASLFKSAADGAGTCKCPPPVTKPRPKASKKTPKTSSSGGRENSASGARGTCKSSATSQRFASLSGRSIQDLQIRPAFGGGGPLFGRLFHVSNAPEWGTEFGQKSPNRPAPPRVNRSQRLLRGVCSGGLMHSCAPVRVLLR